jgi:hypothetical protein
METSNEKQNKQQKPEGVVILPPKFKEWEIPY